MVQLLLAIIYLAFISLGLPDALLGSAWPSIYQEFNVPVSYMGIVSSLISINTVISSLMSDWLNRKLGAGKVTAISVAMTALALLGFSVSSSFWMLCLLAFPYGLGAGSVDAALNNYVATHYSSRHMSWLHCMWGIGASAGPYIMGFALAGGQPWNMGYRYIAFMQMALTAVLIFSLPLWKKNEVQQGNPVDDAKPMTFREVLNIRGVKAIMLTFFCYCGLEQTAGLWGSSFLAMAHGVSAEEAARYGSLFYLGITVGRGASGFLTMKFNDTRMVRMGTAVILAALVLFIPVFGPNAAKVGLVLIGLGCAPIYPSIVHATPARFGAARSQAIIGMQMAVAYVGICLLPPLFGLLADHVTIWLFPVYMLAVTVIMGLMHEKAVKRAGNV